MVVLMLKLICLKKEIEMRKNEFVQLAGCAEGWIINRAGEVKSASGKILKASADGKVTVKSINGNNRAVKVEELLERNFGVNAASNEAVNEVEANEIVDVGHEVTPKEEFKPVSDLSYFSMYQLEAEIERRKLQFIDEIVQILNQARTDHGSEITIAAVNRFMGD